jgi:mannose-6-phosphate isomerase
MKLHASLHETIWGGQRLRESVGKTLPEGQLIGESWETAEDARISEGPYAGSTLAAVVTAEGAEFIGRRAAAIYGVRFPLLAKFLDAHQWLSVQVHPDDAYAAEHEGGKLGKTECWYILHADPGAQIIYGVVRPVSSAEVRAAIERVELEALVQTVEVAPGDAILVPAGTVHAIGAGIVLFELQEYSDVTYRLYDYGRLQANGKPRALHVDRGLDVMIYAPSSVVKVTPIAADMDGAGARRILVACDYFVEEELRISGQNSGEVTDSSLVILANLEGEYTLQGGAGAAMTVQRGETVVLPAGMGSYTMTGQARIIRAYVPEADDAVLLAWRVAQLAAVASK